MLKPALLVTIGLVALPALAQDGRAARYAFIPVTDGTLRLDTATGAVSLCAAQVGTVACHPVPDAPAAFRAELGDLQQRLGTVEAKLAPTPAPAGAGGGTPALVRVAELRTEAGNRLFTVVRRWKAALAEGRSAR